MNEPVPSRFLKKLFWTPVACLLGVEIYARNFDGWSAWATAPLFLIPLALSGAIAGAGIVQCVLEHRAKVLRTSSIVFTGIAAAPLLWLLVRRFVL
jgi:hypothetical protein